MKFGFDWPSGVLRRGVDGQITTMLTTTDDGTWVSYNSLLSLTAQVSLNLFLTLSNQQ